MLAGVVILMTATQAAHGQIAYWVTDGEASWFAPDRWSTSSVPDMWTRIVFDDKDCSVYIYSPLAVSNSVSFFGSISSPGTVVNFIGSGISESRWDTGDFFLEAGTNFFTPEQTRVRVEDMTVWIDKIELNSDGGSGNGDGIAVLKGIDAKIESSRGFELLGSGSEFQLFGSELVWRLRGGGGGPHQGVIGSESVFTTSGSTVTGLTIVNNGRWLVTGNTSLNGYLDGEGSIELSNNAQLSLYSPGTDTVAGDISGAGGVRIGGGVVQLRGSNTFTGGIYLDPGGELRTAGNFLGAASNKIYLNGGFLNLEAASTIDRDIVIQNSGQPSTIYAVSNTLAGDISGAGEVDLVDGAVLNLNGNNEQFYGTMIVAPGTKLSAGFNNSLGAQTTVQMNRGTFELTGDEDWGALNGLGTIDLKNYRARVSEAGDVSLRGTMMGSNAFVMRGTGDLLLQSDLSGFTGTIDAANGNLSLHADAMSTLAGTLRASGGVVELLGNYMIFDRPIENHSVVRKSNGGHVTLTGPDLNSTGVLEINDGTILTTAIYGEKVRLNGGRLELAGDVSGGIDLAASSGVVDRADYTHTVPATSSLTGTGTLLLAGPGSLRIEDGADASGFTGSLVLDGGTLDLAGDLPVATVELRDGTSLRASNGSRPAEVAKITGGGTIELQNAAGAPRDLRVGVNNDSFPIIGAIAGGGTLYKAGTGTLTLYEQADTFPGSLNVEDGTAAVYDASSLGGSTFIQDGARIELRNDIVLNAAASQGISIDGVAGDRGTIDTNGFDLTDARVRANAGTLVKAGNGLLQIRPGTASTTGIYEVAGGTLAARPGPGEGLVLRGGTFRALSSNFAVTDALTVTGSGVYDTQSNTVAISGALLGDGTLTKRGGGQLQFAGDLSGFAGDFTVHEGTLIFQSALPAADLDIQSGASARFESAQSFGGNLSGAGNLLLTVGNGEVQLTGSNGSYAGTIFVGANRTLRAGINDSLGNETRLHILQGSSAVIESAENFGGLSGDGQLEVYATTALGLDGEDSNFGGTIEGVGRLTKAGAGKLTLTGDSGDFAGQFVVTGGALQVDGTLSASLVQMHTGTTLTGQGTITGGVSVTAGASVAPGQSPGVLTTDGILFDTGSTFDVDLAGAGGVPGTDFDLLHVTGQAYLDGELAIHLLDGFIPTPSDTFTILSAQSLTGAFDNAAHGQRLSTVQGDGSFVVTYDQSAGRVVLSQYVPEPTTALLFAIGLAIIAGRNDRGPALQTSRKS